MATPILAFVFMGGWVRSLVKLDRFTLPFGQYHFRQLCSSNGGIIWLRVIAVDATKWSNEGGDAGPQLFDDLARATS
jgi:hypothetical protein